ncbi:MAG: hypothetical protein R6V31_02520 [Halohasta sp.]
MEIRGIRECQACGQQWSYYETGAIRCPDCGAIRSVGVDDRRQLHTDGAAELELEPVRQRLASEPLAHVVDDLKDRLRSYTNRRGFINGGELQPLDDRFLAARELLQAADLAARGREPTETEELYVLELLDGAAAGEWPPETEPPASLEAARGLGVAEAVETYRGDLRTWLDDHPDHEAAKTLGSLREQLKRAEALQGEIPVETANALVTAAHEIGTYLGTDDDEALASARDRLKRLR